MMYTKIPFTAALMAAVAHSQGLDKVTLVGSLDYLQAGLMANMPSVPSTQTQWSAGWIPADCKFLTENAGLSAQDVETFEVTYQDCGSPWILCRHKDSPDPFSNMVDLFGRVPVSARSWVRHMIALPDPGNGHAYNLNGNIAMFNRIDGDLTVFIHETAHSLDLLGAYEQSTNALSSSQAWLDNYAQDPNIPDGYAQSSMLEDVAQSSVVTAFNLNVPGGYGSVETNYEKIFHQYATIQTAQANAGNLLVPGGQCKSRLPNSSPVPQQSSSTSRVMKREEMGEKPNVALEAGLKVIEGKEFDTSGSCQHTR